MLLEEYEWFLHRNIIVLPMRIGILHRFHNLSRELSGLT